MDRVRIALAQLPYPESQDDAIARVVSAIAEAGRERALVVAFPEAYVPGYPWPGRDRARGDAAYLDRARDAASAAARAAGVGVVLGTERFVDGARRLTAIVIAPDGSVLGHQDKVQLDPTEDAGYVPGDTRRIFEIGSLTFGIAICHEGYRYPETVRWAARHGAQVVFHPHHHEPEAGAFRPSTYGDARGSFHEKAVLCRAAENTCWVATINCAIEGAPSTSAIAAPDGTLHAWKPYGEPGLLVSEIDLARATGLLARRYRTVPD